MINIDFKKILNSRKNKFFFILFFVIFIFLPVIFGNFIIYLIISNDNSYMGAYKTPYRKDGNLVYIIRKDYNGMYYLEYSTRSSYFYYNEKLSNRFMFNPFDSRRFLSSCKKGTERVYANKFGILNSEVELEPFIGKQVDVDAYINDTESFLFTFKDKKKQCIKGKCKKREANDNPFVHEFIEITSISLAK